jgi:hypothetical protein
MVQLKKIYASLRDNMSAPADWFPAVESASEVSEGSKTDKLKNKLKQQSPTVTVATLEGGERVDTATGEVLSDQDLLGQ